MNKGEIGIRERSGLVYEETETFSRDLEFSLWKEFERVRRNWRGSGEGEKSKDAEEDVRGNASYVSTWVEGWLSGPL